MRRVERLLEQARSELAKVKQLLDKSTLKKRHTALAEAKQLEQDHLPTPEERLEEEHRFAAYEADLQKMMVPMEDITPKPPKKKKASKKKAKKKEIKKSTKKKEVKKTNKKAKTAKKATKDPTKKVKKNIQKSKKKSVNASVKKKKENKK